MSIKILFLCSGGGGNLRFIYEAINQGWLHNSEICGVLTDRECGANQFSALKNIENNIIDYNSPKQNILLDTINSYNPDVVVTTVHRIICDEIVFALREKLINLHYSLLPAFGGVIGSMPVRKALEYGVKFVGTTVHFVSENVDAGFPIIQSVTPVYPADTEEVLMEFLFRCGSICMLNAIQGQTQQSLVHSSPFDMVVFKSRKSYFNPAALIPERVKMESFWMGIKDNDVTD